VSRNSPRVDVDRVDEESNPSRSKTLTADIFKYKVVCPYLRQKEDYLPPYCKNPNNCEDIFEYAGIKYCKRELK